MRRGSHTGWADTRWRGRRQACGVFMRGTLSRNDATKVWPFHPETKVLKRNNINALFCLFTVLSA
jgi:hypothetical protein